MAEGERSPEPVEGLGPEPAEGTIAVGVRYYNVFRLRIGIERETIVLPEGTSLRSALERLAERHGSVLRQMLFAPDGRVASHLVVFRNRKLVPHDERHAPLADGDELMLFPAVAGG
jgi:molybdopterin converting factor small subunit